VRHHDSEDSYVQSIDKETDSSTAPLSPQAEAQMSASQILTRSDVFHTPAVHRMDTLASMSTEPSRRSSEAGTMRSGSPPRVQTSPVPIRPLPDAQQTRRSNPQNDALLAPDAQSGQKMIRNDSSPTLQDLVKAGSYPLQRAGAFADYLKNRSTSMRKLLATESMSYLEKVSGMWAGNRKHYGENEGVVPDDRGIDPEDEEANVGHGDRFRAHFALPATEKLQATYFGFLHRVLPLYGKIYISNRKFCFRSLLPGTRTKLVLPVKDIENVDKEKGFRFGYHGLVLVIRGHEELFFEFSSAEHRDDCTITLLHSLETVRYMAGSGVLQAHDDDDTEVAKEEYRKLQEARRSSTAGDHALVLPDTAEAIYSHKDEESSTSILDNTGPILYNIDPRASILNLSKPTASLRVTCLTIGSRGDVQPYIALCKGLLAEGHRPRIATHSEFEPWVRKHGIDFRPVDGDPAELMRICVENGMFTYSFLREASAKFRTWIDELLSSAWNACQDSDLLIESPSAMAGIHIAEALGIPYFRAFTMPWTRTRAYPHAFAVPEHKIGGAYNYYSYVMFDNVFWKAIAGQVNRWRKKELGLRSTNLDKMQPNKVPFLYNFSPMVVPPPLDYSDWVRVTGYWFLDEGSADWTPPEDLTNFIKKARQDGKKLVYIGFGSIVVSDPAALTKTVVESVLKADVRCILSKGWSDRLGNPDALKAEVPLPDDILQIKSAPHDWLFRQIDAACHHGGAGTTGASLRAGLPTVVKPFFGDQFFFGSRVEDLGVGICLKKVNVSLFSRALWEATHSERMIVKARLLGEMIRKVSFAPQL
jgi:sterol 3beta-glucosyltransferase